MRNFKKMQIKNMVHFMLPALSFKPVFHLLVCVFFCAFLGSHGYALVLLLFCLIFSEWFLAFGKNGYFSKKTHTLLV